MRQGFQLLFGLFHAGNIREYAHVVAYRAIGVLDGAHGEEFGIYLPILSAIPNFPSRQWPFVDKLVQKSFQKAPS